MDKLSVTRKEARENAFFVWYSSSRNDSEAERELKRQGYTVTRQTIGEWKRKYDWVTRAEALDFKKAQSLDTMRCLEDTLLAELTTQKDRYKAYFDSLPTGQVDNQATYAYSQLCRQIADITDKIKKAAEGKDTANEPIDLTIKFVEPGGGKS